MPIKMKVAIVFGSEARDQRRICLIHRYPNLTKRLLNTLLVPSFVMAKDLKSMLKVKEAKEEAQTFQKQLKDLEEMDIKTLGLHVLTVGKKYINQTFEVAYQDPTYLKWVVAHCPEDDRSSQGMQKFLVYVRRRLTEEVIEQAESKGSESPPLTSQTTKIDKGGYKTAVKVPVPAANEMEEDEENLSQWSQVDVSRVESIEHEVGLLRQNGVELCQRMSNLEGTIQQIYQFLKEKGN